MRKYTVRSARLQRTLLLLCSLLAGTARLHAQPTLDQSPWHLYADSLIASGQTKAAFDWLESEKANLEQQNRQQSPDYVAVLFAIGKQQFRSRNLKQAIPSLQSALDLHRQLAPADLPNQAMLLYALADCYEYSPEPNKAIPLYENALDLSLIVYGDNTRQAARGYYELAIIHTLVGDYETAETNGLKAVRCLKNAGLSHEADYSGYHQVLGWIHHEEGNLTQALHYYLLALPMLRERLGLHDETAKCLSTIGEAYAKMGDIPKALEYQLSAANMFEQTGGSKNRYLPACLGHLGATYNHANQPLKALEYLRRARNLGAPATAPGPFLSVQFSKAYRSLGNYDQALAYADTALAGRPERAGAAAMYSWYALLEKAQVLIQMYQQEQNDSLLVEAGDLLAEAQATVSRLIAGFHAERNKLAVFHEALKGFDLAIDANTQLFESTGQAIWLKTAFELSETGKGMLLYQQFLENKIRRQKLLPPDLAEADQFLRLQIIAAEKKLFELGENAAQPETDVIQEEIFRLRNQQKQLLDTIQALYSSRSFEITAFPASNLDSAQRRIAPTEALLEFFTGDSTITAFLVLPDTLFFQKIPSKTTVEKHITQLREASTRYHTAKEKSGGLYIQAAADYAESAHTLYQLLLAPFREKLPARLTIVPDGALAYLPFEALLVEKPERPDRFHLHHYFGADCVLRYAPSATLLREMENLPLSRASTGHLLALAPFFDGSTVWTDSLQDLASRARTDLAPLPHSGEEAYKIVNMTGGKALTGAEASKQAFITEAPNYPVLHLATHAQANDRAGDYSFLAFPPPPGQSAPDRLYVSDIYGLRLNAELVTLSACETGLGQLLRGEGIVSIARAFSAAGTRSIVQSQWVVGDSQTRHLMELFYENLKNGQPKDVALAEAKRDYLKKFKGEFAHPYFWAGFILIGDNAPLSFF